MMQHTVQASIITIGDELLIGQVIDTNSAFIATALNNIGIWVKRRIAVGDVKEDILEALDRQRTDCRLIIITGGLGPTADDVTKPALCEYFNAKMIIDEGALQNVKNIFARLNRPLTERNTRQAEVPGNCTVLHNSRGTAPGMWFEKNNTIYISLPGVPHEMKGLIEDEVIPRLKSSFSLTAIVHKTLITSGIGESYLADAIAGFEDNLPAHFKLAYLPAYRMVKLRLTGYSGNETTLKAEADNLFGELKDKVREWLIADEDVTLQELVTGMLRAKNKWVATAESCTGGYLAHLLTARAGASDIFKGSVIAYANDVKEKALGVQQETLVEYGAVSEETVTEMVNGVLALTHADYAMATSGIMGPGGGTQQKPAGTVWIAAGNRNKIITVKHSFHYDRKMNIELTANAALVLLRKFLLEEESGKL